MDRPLYICDDLSGKAVLESSSNNVSDILSDPEGKIDGGISLWLCVMPAIPMAVSKVVLIDTESTG